LKGYEILNLGESKTITLIDLVRLIEKEINKKAIIEWLPMQPGDVNHTFADIGKAKYLFGYHPRMSIETGIKHFVEWFRHNEN
jgi:UDP-glucuronate 4-epimerase